MDHCQAENCLGEPYFKCGNEECAIKLCTLHIGDHTNSKGHFIKDNSIELTEKQAIIFTSTLQGVLKRIKQCRDEIYSKTLESLNYITDLAAQGVSKLKEQEVVIYKVLEQISKSKWVAFKENQSKSEEFILKYFSRPESMLEDFEGFKANIEGVKNFQEYIRQKSEDCDEVIRKCNEEIEKVKEICEFEKQSEVGNAYRTIAKYTGIDINILDKEFPPKYMPYCEEGTKNFCLVRVFAEKDLKFTLPINENLSHYNCFCELPENKYFSYGGCQGAKNNTYIIDLETREIQQFTPYKIKNSGGGNAIYYNGAVYIFGGYDSATIKRCEKFSIIDNKWSEISDLPTATHCNPTALLNNQMIIAGYHTPKLYFYNIEANKFDTYGAFQPNTHKYLLARKNDLWFVDAGKLYKNSNAEYTQFDLIDGSTGVSQSYLASYPIICGKYVFFVLTTTEIFRLDTELNKISLVRKAIF
jgi:hypothetical protein